MAIMADISGGERMNCFVISAEKLELGKKHLKNVLIMLKKINGNQNL